MATKKTKSTSKTKTPAKTAKKKTVAKSTPRKTVHATEPYHPAFGLILLVVCIVLLAVLIPVAYNAIVKYSETDAMRFSDEYSLVEYENVYVYKSAEETEKVLKNGTGVVFLGFPECPWCQTYAKMLNDVAKEKGIKEISYYNIKNDRKENTSVYKNFVEILSAYLQYNDDGDKYIYVPNVTFVVDGKIIGNDLETSKDLAGAETPEEYWTEERVSAWKEKIGALMDKILEAQGCTTTCNE